MNWDDARRLLGIPLTGPRALQTNGGPPEGYRRPLHEPRVGSVCVASGKGGTGKSVVTASLARLFSRQGRTLVVDADMGVGNAHILQDVTPAHSLVDVVEGRLSVREAVTRCTDELDLLSAGSGVSHMASLSSYELQMVATGIEAMERDYRFVLLDSAAGISNQTIAFAASCDLVLLVTTPDLTAMTDVYAFLKVLTQKRPGVVPLLVVNRVATFDEAEHVAERICSVARKFLDLEPRWVGSIPDDGRVTYSVNHRVPVVHSDEKCAAAQALRGLSVVLLEELAQSRHPGVGRTLARETFAAGSA